MTRDEMKAKLTSMSEEERAVFFQEVNATNESKWAFIQEYVIGDEVSVREVHQENA